MRALYIIFKIADILDFVLFVVGIGAGSATVIAALNEIPVWCPIILGVVCFVFITYETARIVFQYRRWAALRNDPQTLEVLNILQEMHDRLGVLSKYASKQKVDEDKIRKVASVLSGEIVGLDEQQYRQYRQSIPNSYKDIKRIFGTKLSKYLRNLYKLRKGDVSSFANMFYDVGVAMDKEGYGLTKRIDRDEIYQSLYRRLKTAQLGLTLKKPNNIIIVDEAVRSSFALQSMVLCWALLKKTKASAKIYSGFSGHYIDKNIKRYDGLYTVVLQHLKVKLMIESLKA